MLKNGAENGAIQNTPFHMKPCVYCFSLLMFLRLICKEIWALRGCLMCSFKLNAIWNASGAESRRKIRKCLGDPSNRN